MTADPSYATRLEAAVETGLRDFESNGGNAAQHGGAMYCKLQHKCQLCF